MPPLPPTLNPPLPVGQSWENLLSEKIVDFVLGVFLPAVGSAADLNKISKCLYEPYVPQFNRWIWAKKK